MTYTVKQQEEEGGRRQGWKEENEGKKEQDMTQCCSKSHSGFICELSALCSFLGLLLQRKTKQTGAKAALSPLHIHSGDIERDSFQPQHHEQTLGEGTVADALTVAPRLGHTTGRESVSEAFLVTF